MKVQLESDVPLPWIPAAVTRWIEEHPDSETGGGELEKLALEAIYSGLETPAKRIMNLANGRFRFPSTQRFLWIGVNSHV